MNFQNGTRVNFYEKPDPGSSEISDFTPCANAQSDILHIKHAALRKLMTRAQDLRFRYKKENSMQGVVWELYCSLSICLNLFSFRVSACFAYDKTVINQRRFEKSAFEDKSEEIQCEY